MPSVNRTPRPLRDIVRDLEVRDVRMSKALAEEAIASVAADGVASRDEARILEAYADGPMSYAKDRRDRLPGWREGSETGRALFNALATAVSNAVLHAEVHDKLVTVKGEPAAIDVMNPFSWWTAGWATTTTGAALETGTSAPALIDEVRKRAVGWVHNSVDDALSDYPKATVNQSTYRRVPLPQVQVEIDKLRADWLAGRIDDRKDIASSLRTYLDANFRR